VLKEEGEILVIEPTIEGEVQRIFSLVRSENQAILNAQESLRRCDFKVSHSELFYARWLFDDKEDVVQSVFDYYDMPFDASIAEGMRDLLGDKAEDRPIELWDELSIQSLGKHEENASGMSR